MHWNAYRLDFNTSDCEASVIERAAEGSANIITMEHTKQYNRQQYNAMKLLPHPLLFGAAVE